MKAELLKELQLSLPKVTEKENTTKRPVGVPNPDILNDEQLTASFEIMQDCLLGDKPMHVLKGYAGTGKTFLTGYLIEQILHKKLGRIAIAAPTNKAVKVIKDTCPITDSRIVFDTIHSLLGLREQIDGYGNQKFVQLKREHAKLDGFAILIVDEASMLQDELFELLNEYTSNGFGGMKIVFVGDPAQIPPVKRKDCIPFDKDKQIIYNIGESNLTEIVRQAETNPLIEASMKLRNNLARPNPIPVKDSFLSEGEKGLEGIVYASDRGTEVDSILDTYFKSGNYLKDSDFVKVIGWRNKTVNRYNSSIRNMIYGEGSDKICVGERLIVNKPILVNEQVVFTTNDEVTVLKLTEERGTIRDMDLKYYSASVVANGMPEDAAVKIRILHEESEELFNEYVKYLVESAKAMRKGSWEAAGKWKDVYRFKETFADVNYSYAITAHKSQGSTYDNAIVLAYDIEANRNVVERNRIKYTAYTRPKNVLVIVD